MLLLLLIKKTVPWKGPESTEMITLVLREEMEESGRIPNTLISDLLKNQKYKPTSTEHLQED